MSRDPHAFERRLAVTNKLWLVADTHFGHRNIIKYQQRPESHEAIMLSEWIYSVGEDEPILHLGDVFLGPQGSPGRWAAIIHRLPGRKYLILGNHDKSKREIYERAGFTIIEPFVHRGIAFTHRPITDQYPLWAHEGETSHEAATRLLHAEHARSAGEGWHTNIHGHIHGNTLGAVLVHDGSPLPGKTYVNVSVEVTQFKPVRVGNVCPLVGSDS